MRHILITAPSLQARTNVGGISALVSLIIDSNAEARYEHFIMGKADGRRRGPGRVVEIARAYLRWRRRLQAGDAVVVHYNMALSTLAVARDVPFILYAYRRRVPLVVHIHGGRLLTAHRIGLVWRWVLRRVFALPVPFIVLSPYERRLVARRFGARRVVSLPNSVSLASAQAFRRSVPGGRPLTLGYLGRIERNKGFDHILEACRELALAGTPFTLRLAGVEQGADGYLPRLQAQLGERCVYDGIVSGADKDAFLRRLDVLLFPSYFEGLPMALLEAMSYGAVPVATPVGSIPTVVSDGVNGLLIPLRSGHALAAAVRRLHADRALFARLSAEARATVFDHYGVGPYVRRLNEIYDMSVQTPRMGGGDNT